MRSILVSIVAFGCAFLAGVGLSLGQPILRPPDPVLQADVANAEAKTKLAAFEVDEANKKLQAVQDRLEAKFKERPDWVAAATKLDGAKSALKSAMEAAQSALDANPDYVAAKAKLDQVQADLNKAKAEGDPPDVIIPLATERMQASSDLNNIKIDAVTNSAAVQSAKADLATAQASVDKLHADFVSTLSSDAEWNTANSVVDERKSTWVEERAKLTAAQEILSQDIARKRQVYDEELARWNANQPGPHAQGVGVTPKDSSR